MNPQWRQMRLQWYATTAAPHISHGNSEASVGKGPRRARVTRGSVTGTAGADSDEEVSREVSDSAPFSAYVFRTMVDQFGRVSIMKVQSGVLRPDTNVVNVSTGTAERIGPVHAVQGKDLVDFVRNGLLDPRARPEQLRKLIPPEVPSGRPVPMFE